MPDVVPQCVAVRTAMPDYDARIKSLLESIESGIDHELVAPRVRQLQVERSRLEATLGIHNRWRWLSAREIVEWAASLGGMLQVLKQANPEDRAALYAALRSDRTLSQGHGGTVASRPWCRRGCVGGPTARMFDW
jgi:hypothetical protein